MQIIQLLLWRLSAERNLIWLDGVQMCELLGRYTVLKLFQGRQTYEA